MKIEDIVGELIMRHLANCFTRRGLVKFPLTNAISALADQPSKEPQLDTPNNDVSSFDPSYDDDPYR